MSVYLKSPCPIYGTQGFLSKFLMGGPQKFLVPIGDEVRWEGGLAKKNLTEAKTAHLMQN